MKRKSYIFIVAAIFLIIAIFGLVRKGAFDNIINNENAKDKETVICVSNWDGMEKRYSIGRAELLSKPVTNNSECRVSFQSKQKLENIFNDNDDYLETIEFCDEMLVHKAKLFYSDNSYYVVYETGDENTFNVTACYSRYEMNNSISYVPTPYYIAMNTGSIEYYREEKIDISQIVFDKYTFDDFKDFYSKMDDKYYSVDEGKRVIYVSGYDVKEKRLVTNLIKVDYLNRKLEGLDETGKYIEIL